MSCDPSSVGRILIFRFEKGVLHSTVRERREGVHEVGVGQPPTHEGKGQSGEGLLLLFGHFGVVGRAPEGKNDGAVVVGRDDEGRTRVNFGFIADYSKLAKKLKLSQGFHVKQKSKFLTSYFSKVSWTHDSGWDEYAAAAMGNNFDLATVSL